MKHLIVYTITILSFVAILSITSFANGSCESTLLDSSNIESVLSGDASDASLLVDGALDPSGRFSNITGLSWMPSAVGDTFTVTLKEEISLSAFAFYGWSNGSTYTFEFFDKNNNSVFLWEEIISVETDEIQIKYLFENQSYNVKTIVFTATKLKLNSPKTCLISEIYLYSQSHSFGDEISYSFPNGLMGDSIVNNTCSICGHTISKTDKPIFEHLGYSVKSDNSLGLCAMFNINRDALSWYKENISSDFTYGLAAANIATFNDSQFFDENGCITNEKSLQLQVNDDSFSRLNLTITDFTAETSSLELVIFMYVKQGDTYTYIQKPPYDGYYTSSITKNGVSLGAITISRVQSLVNVATIYALPFEEKKY